MVQVISVQDQLAERFLFDRPRGVNLEHKTILSFGGGGKSCGNIPIRRIRLRRYYSSSDVLRRILLAARR